MSFASEPERDDGGLPPVNVVIPDDARELDRDVLAYRREMRALRRRQRRGRLLRPFLGPRVGGPAAIVPLIALCLALALVGGALLSVLTISPAEQDNAFTPSAPRASAAPTALTTLPPGDVRLDGETKPVRSLVSSAIALVPRDCGCGPSLSRLVDQARAGGAQVVYFIGLNASSAELSVEVDHFGNGHAIPGLDSEGVLAGAYHPSGLTVLLVYSDATAEVRKNLSGSFRLGLTPDQLIFPGPKADAEPTAQANPTANPAAGAATARSTAS
ncbi:MAG TPA: hypothetical protein VHZ33_35565 [Trebonia sp.]|nr:hypothetical protein [Trebonia sp.]